MNAIVKTCGEIAVETNCAIGLVHHSRKTNGQEVSVEDARGGSALVAGTRIARVLNRMTATKRQRRASGAMPTGGISAWVPTRST